MNNMELYIICMGDLYVDLYIIKFGYKFGWNFLFFVFGGFFKMVEN